jgi:heme exporter protein A
VLNIDGLACGYAERALFRGLRVSLRAGDMARVLGDNGAGKTTLLRTVAGLNRPLDGTVRWRRSGAERDADPIERRMDLCFVGHNNALNGALTPVENLGVLTQLAGQPVAPGRIRETLVMLGLRRLARRPCRALSAGQQRRVSLARLWLMRAPLWLLDEPGAALDADARACLSERMTQNAAAGGIVIFTAHDTLAIDYPVQPIALPAC